VSSAIAHQATPPERTGSSIAGSFIAMDVDLKASSVEDAKIQSPPEIPYFVDWN
jgi:hypothetical protein